MAASRIAFKTKTRKRADNGSMGHEDVIQCMYGLTKTDMAVFASLADGDGRTAAQVASIIKRDRSVAHRSLEKLITCALLDKRRRGRPNRGYENIYTMKPERELLERTRQASERALASIKERLAGLG